MIDESGLANAKIMKSITQFYFNRIGWMDRYDFWIQRIDITRGDQASLAVATNIEFRTVEEHCEAAALTTLSREEAQQMMDSLYEAGLRPSQTPNTVAVLPAVQHHLSDMRKIASKYVGVDL